MTSRHQSLMRLNPPRSNPLPLLHYPSATSFPHWRRSLQNHRSLRFKLWLLNYLSWASHFCPKKRLQHPHSLCHHSLSQVLRLSLIKHSPLCSKMISWAGRLFEYSGSDLDSRGSFSPVGGYNQVFHSYLTVEKNQGPAPGNSRLSTHLSGQSAASRMRLRSDPMWINSP